MVEAIERLKAKLAEYPSVAYKESPGSITVDPKAPSGFRVSLHATSDGCFVEFDKWHEQLESVDEAIDLFGFGLSNACRLVITYQGSMASKWVVESLYKDGRWVPIREMGLILFPFWLGKRIEYKQNDIIPVR
jgi:hypothetical protein